MNKMVLGQVTALLKDTEIGKKGNFLGKAKAFASKLSQTLGSEDESVEVDVSTEPETSEQGQTKKLFDGESKKEREARLAAEADAKKKTTTMIIAAVAVLAFMLLKKK